MSDNWGTVLQATEVAPKRQSKPFVSSGKFAAKWQQKSSKLKQVDTANLSKEELEERLHREVDDDFFKQRSAKFKNTPEALMNVIRVSGTIVSELKKENVLQSSQSMVSTEGKTIECPPNRH